MDFDVSQLNTLTADLGRAGAAAVPLARKVLGKSSADIERDAKAFAPVDTGNLRNSISRDLMGLKAEIGPTAAYGAYVEFGTSRMAPEAYMGPALDRNGWAFEKAMDQIADGLL